MATRTLAKGTDEMSKYIADQLTAKRKAAYDQANQAWQQGERDLASGSGQQGANYIQTGPGYSWDQFEQAARGAGLYDKFSDADLALARSNPNAGMSILSAKQQYGEAQSPEAKAMANARAEAIRSSYGGYTGGTSGSYYNLNPLSPIQYQDSAREQQTRQRMEEAYQKMQGPYDPEADPAYQAYRKQYLREGRRATEDTMAIAAGMTGGRPSSYAVTAAGQQGNYYAAQLTDKIPQLYQQAYERYYQQYQQQANQYNQDRGFAYGQLTDEVQNQRYLRGEETQAKQQALENAMKAYELGDSRQLEALGIDTSKDLGRKLQLLQIAQTAAAYGDYSQLEAMGFDTTRANFQNDLAVAQLIAQYTGDTSGLYALMRGSSLNAGDAGATDAAIAGSSGGSYSGGSAGGSYRGSYGGGSSGSSGGGSGSKTTTQPTAGQTAAKQTFNSNGYPSSTGGYGVSASSGGKTTQSVSGVSDWNEYTKRLLGN